MSAGRYACMDYVHNLPVLQIGLLCCIHEALYKTHKHQTLHKVIFTEPYSQIALPVTLT